MAIATTAAIGCMAESADSEMGSIGMELQLAPGVTINTLNWTINNASTGFSRADTVNVRSSTRIAFLVGAIPTANNYTISLTGVSVDGAFTCAGAAAFSIMPGVSTPVTVSLNCSVNAPNQGTIIVTGTTQICANLDSISASPLETAVNTPIALVATASVGSLTPAFAWTATAGSFDNAASATPVFTCPATPGAVTISVTVSPSAPTCNTVITRSVTVTCSTLAPTFTNVYASVIAARCTSCHRPGGSGVTVGMLDLNTPAAAFSNLVNVTAKGIGAGTSGITCASVTPPLIRVLPGDATTSLLYTKVHSKLVGALAPCGSPMPLPGGALSLTAAEVDLIGGWIAAGALND